MDLFRDKTQGAADALQSACVGRAGSTHLHYRCEQSDRAGLFAGRQMKFSNVSKLFVLGLIVTASSISCKTRPPGVTQLPKNGIGSSQSTADNISNTPALHPDDGVKADANGLFGLDDKTNRSKWNAN